MGFKKIDKDGTLPGPRALFICGFTDNDHQTMRGFLKGKGIEEVDVIPCRQDSLDKKIGSVLQGDSTAAIIEAEKLPPVMLWSGIAHEELDEALGEFQNTGLKRPIFATTTIPNMEFTVKELLQHLISEQRSMREAMKKNKT